MSNLITFMQHPTGVLTSVIRQEKEIEGTHIKQEERKPSLFDITINVEKSQRIYKRKLLEPVNYFNKVTGYKINIQKSITFLHTSKEQL